MQAAGISGPRAMPTGPRIRTSPSLPPTSRTYGYAAARLRLRDHAGARLRRHRLERVGFIHVNTLSNTPPVATINDHSLHTNEWSQVANWISYSDADNNAATQYQFWDSGTDVEQRVFLDREQCATGQRIRTSPSQPPTSRAYGYAAAELRLRNHAGARLRRHRLERVESFTFNTLSNTPPVATINDHSLHTNEWSQVTNWISYSDADDNAATQYQFWDSGTASSSGYSGRPTIRITPPTRSSRSLPPISTMYGCAAAQTGAPRQCGSALMMAPPGAPGISLR